MPVNDPIIGKAYGFSKKEVTEFIARLEETVLKHYRAFPPVYKPVEGD